MLGTYIPVLVMLVVATVVAVVMVVGSFLLGPKHPTRFKGLTYECGVTPVGTARERFPIQFYLIAMLFIIFDIETIFLYPWAVIFRGPRADRFDKIFLFGEMAVFVAILFVGFAYIWGKGVFDWYARAEETEQTEPQVLRRRPPITFGNENTGPVRLPASTPVSGLGSPGSELEEERRAPVPAGDGR